MTRNFALAIATFALTTAAFSQGGANKEMMKPTLYDKLGGIHKIAQFVSDAVDMESKDETLLMNKNFKWGVDNYPRQALKFAVTNYIASHTGGPQKPCMTEPMMELPQIVRWLNFNKMENDHAWEIRMMAMEKAGVPMEAQKELRMWFDKEVMKAKPMQPMPETFKNKTSLYARLGGIVPISLVVDEFINLLATDMTVGSNPNVVKSLTSGKVSGAGLKYLVTEQLGQASGGPWKYSGKTMAESHKGLMISEKEWEASAKLLKMVLDKYKVPAKEQGEVFAAISGTKGDIVGR